MSDKYRAWFQVHPLNTSMKWNGFTAGDWVRSQYRARWYGVIIGFQDCTYRGREHWCAWVSIKYDKRGNKMRKPLLTRLDTYWLSHTLTRLDT